jgi:hypothetical protein
VLAKGELAGDVVIIVPQVSSQQCQSITLHTNQHLYQQARQGACHYLYQQI